MKNYLAGAALLLSAGTADAAVFNWTVSAPDFYNVVSGYNLSEAKSGNDVTLRWGVPSSRNPGLNSGYLFDGQNGSLSINPGETKDFVFAYFTHYNWDITRPSGMTDGAIDGVSLTFDLTTLGFLTKPIYQITHNETLNNYQTFPACCNDTVKTPGQMAFEVIDGNLKYVVTLAGLDLSTREQSNNKVAWLGKVSLEDLTPVPVPPALALFGAGLMGILRLSKKRR